MERPQYANAFSMIYNPDMGEVIINFTVNYPKEPQTNPNGEPIQVEHGREGVSSILLPRKVAAQLVDMASKVLQQGEKDEGAI